MVIGWLRRYARAEKILVNMSDLFISERFRKVENIVGVQGRGRGKLLSADKTYQGCVCGGGGGKI